MANERWVVPNYEMVLNTKKIDIYILFNIPNVPW